MKWETFFKSLGIELRLARMAAGLTREDVSEITKLSLTAIETAEQGAADLELSNFVLLSHTVGVNPKELMKRAYNKRTS
ncbi:helix-turn-helix domain-containing protein [Chitinophaga rhizosphaerae]|uniref:helix-turn-helix domain-containing protein n=1 Tax=Chitinophaga rhizosphaerae TaxID=1864947 RepID=UPI000F80594B|nr:helix-turn-helix domain-containing protein [Chitinophaga rhizosphaerae]